MATETEKLYLNQQAESPGFDQFNKNPVGCALDDLAKGIATGTVACIDAFTNFYFGKSVLPAKTGNDDDEDVSHVRDLRMLMEFGLFLLHASQYKKRPLLAALPLLTRGCYCLAKETYDAFIKFVEDMTDI